MCEEKVSKFIAELVKMGIVNQFTGEDGEFYFTITEIGKKVILDLGWEIEDEPDVY